MNRYLLAGTAIAALATPLAAQTTIDSRRTDPIRTSELKSGAGDSVKVTDKGSVERTSGAAITLDSNHNVVNEGKIVVTNAEAGSGITVAGDRTGNITNSGTITVDETYTPTDSDNDKDLDGPFAVGGNRAAIRVQGKLAGQISHTGTISVEGTNSAGILVQDTLTGGLVHDGKTTVLGDNSVGVDLRAVTGDVRLAGTVAATGADAMGARFGGDIGGGLTVQGEIAATGYRYPAAPADASKLDSDDLLQGGSALLVEGSVAKGIIFAVAPKDTKPDDADEDKDGLADAKEGSAKVTSYGAAPAVLIGASDRDIVIGAVPGTGTGFGIVVDGAIAGHGVYAGVAGNGMVVGGRGGAVSVNNGIAVSGTITASSKDSGATALRLGSGARVPELRNSGTISAADGKAAAASSIAVLVEADAEVPLIRNSGTIKATAAGNDAFAGAIVDRSGRLRVVENSGKIVATGSSSAAGRNVAIDLSSVASGATVRQTAVGSGIEAPVIEGDIRFGAGADLLDIADGAVKGGVTFGAGVDRLALSGDGQFIGTASFGGQADRLSLAGTSTFSGTADFAGGNGALTIADKAAFVGKLQGGQNLSVAVDGGLLDITAPTAIGSLAVGANGVIGATLSKQANAGTAISVAGTASFEKGSKLKLRLTDIAQAEGLYQVIEAGNLVGAGNLAADSALVPFMYKAALAVNEAAGTVSVDIDRKETKDLGLNRSEGAAYDHLYQALAADAEVAGVFLGITEANTFKATVAQALPDHAGGSFDGISLGVRTFARTLATPDSPIEQVGKLSVLFDFAGWDSTRGEGDTASYDLDGLGFSGGLELATGIGRIGATGTWLWNRHDSGIDNNVISNTYEAAAYWRGDWGAFSGFARGSYGFSDFEGSRYFVGMNGDKKIERTIDGQWSGNVVSFIGGASVEGGSQFFFIRPSISLDYVRLSEDGYTETGGGKALDLTIETRESDEMGLNLAIAAGADLLGMRSRDQYWARIEAEGGRREILSGDIGATTARFGTGESFTLLPDQQASGWFGRVRGVGGDEFYTISGELSAEERNSEIGYGLRASISFKL